MSSCFGWIHLRGLFTMEESDLITLRVSYGRYGNRCAVVFPLRAYPRTMPRLLCLLESLLPARKASKHAGDNAGGEALCALAFSDPIYLHCLRLPTCSVRPYNILEKMAHSLLVLQLG